MFYFGCKIKKFLSYCCGYLRVARMSTKRAILVVVCLCVVVYVTLAINQTNSGQFQDLPRFHQFYLKGQWVFIPSQESKRVARLKASDQVPATQQHQRSLCHTYIGRLGNMMFQYASVYALAKNSGHRIVVSAGFHLRDIFPKLGKYFYEFKPCLGYTKLFEREPYEFEPAVTHLPNDTDYLLEGFLQSWKYFEHYKNDIKEQFTFHEPIYKQASFSLNVALDSFRQYINFQDAFGTFVGIHVRRGDYAKFFPVNTTLGVNLPTASYFQRAKDYFRSRYRSPLFVVCSDDIDWCEENIDSQDTVFIRGNSPEVDLALLSSLNHTITSFGTYTFWAAWLTNGVTLYPANIVDDHFHKRKDIYLRDHVYHSWIPI